MKNVFILIAFVVVCGFFGMYIEKDFIKQATLAAPTIYIMWFAFKLNWIWRYSC